MSERDDQIQESRPTAHVATQLVPDDVRRHVQYWLTRLRDAEAALEGVQLARGNGHILALEVRDRKVAIEMAQTELNEFRELARKNGVDGDAFIQSLGGQPDFARFGEPAPAPVGHPSVSDEVAAPRPRMRA
jgi:acetylornithine/succinyldiaminopimelate/putrescine aminotransferase